MREDIRLNGKFVEKVGCMSVLAEIDFYIDRYNGEIPTIETLSKRFKVANTTIKKKLNDLSMKGYIEFNKSFKYAKNYIRTNKKVLED